MGMGIQISEFLLLVLWGVYPAVGLPVHPVILCFIFFLSNIILFSVVPIPFYIFPSVLTSSNFSTSSATLVIFFKKKKAIPMSVNWQLFLFHGPS